MTHLFVLAVGLAAGTLSGVVGSGASIILLPVLVASYGPKHAVPVMAVAAVMSNLGKMAAWWRDIDWRACAAYSLPGVPAAALGAATLVALPATIVNLALGAFFLAMIPLRHRLARASYRMPLWQLALAGAAIGYLTGIVLSTGPLSIPAFTSYGLAKGPLLATEAAASLLLMLTKATTFRTLGALPRDAIVDGLVIGAAVMAGTFLAKAIVKRMALHHFHRAMDATLLVAGIALLVQAARG